MPIDRIRAQQAIFDFLCALGRDPRLDPELSATPERVVDAFENDLLTGYDANIQDLIESGSSIGSQSHSEPPKGIVQVQGIALATLCPHHLMPALGTADVAYLPGERLLGIGTLTRVVDAYARRLTLQEQIGENVVRALVQFAGAQGAHCRIRLRHSCLSARGSRQSGAQVVTVAEAGAKLPECFRGGEAGG